MSAESRYKKIMSRIKNRRIGVPEKDDVSIYDTYKTLPTDTESDTPRWEARTDSTVFSSLPEVIGGGQIIKDLDDPDKFIKSPRPKYNSQESIIIKDIFRGGLSADHFEVDHIMPLALGGPDTLANRQLLPKHEHDQKTKVGAVVQALYFDNKMDKGEARALVANWKNKNVDDIILDEYGAVDTEIALKKIEDWKKVKEIDAGDWWDAAKEVPGDFVDYLGETVDKIMPENPLGELGKGFVNSLALGYASAPTAEHYEDANDKVMAMIQRGAGEIAGTALSLYLGYGILGRGIQLMLNSSKLTRIPAIIRKIQALKNTDVAVKGATGAKEVIDAMKKGKGVKNALSNVKYGELIMPRNTAYKAIRDGGVFTIHGQLSKQEEAGLEHRIARIGEDFLWGSFMSALPTTAPTGIIKKAKFDAGVFTGSLTLGAMLGNDAPEALSNALLITGMHKFGMKMDKKRFNDIGDDFAITQRKKWGMTENKPGVKYTEEQINRENPRLIKAITNKFNNPKDIENEVTSVLSAGRQLYKRGLTREARLLADNADLKSLSARYRSFTKSKLEGISEDSVPFLDRFKKIKNEKYTPSKADEASPLVNRQMMTTGIGDSVSKFNNKSIKKFVDNGGKAGDKILIYQDPKKEKFMIKQNEGKGQYETSGNSKYNLEIIGQKKDNNYSLGSHPSENRIDKRENNINETLISKGQIPVDPKFNKDFVGEEMEKEGLETIVATIVGVGKRAETKPHQPWMRFEIKPEDLAASRKMNNISAPKKVKKTKKTSTKKVDQEFSASQKLENNKTLFKENKIDNSEATIGSIKAFEDTIGHPKETVKLFGMLRENKLTKNEKRVIAEKSRNGEMSVKEIRTFLEMADKNNTLNSYGRQFYNAISGFRKKLPDERKLAFDDLKVKNRVETTKKPITKKKTTKKVNKALKNKKKAKKETTKEPTPKKETTKKVNKALKNKKKTEKEATEKVEETSSKKKDVEEKTKEVQTDKKETTEIKKKTKTRSKSEIKDLESEIKDLRSMRFRDPAESSKMLRMEIRVFENKRKILEDKIKILEDKIKKNDYHYFDLYGSANDRKKIKEINERIKEINERIIENSSLISKLEGPKKKDIEEKTTKKTIKALKNKKKDVKEKTEEVQADKKETTRISSNRGKEIIDKLNESTGKKKDIKERTTKKAIKALDDKKEAKKTTTKKAIKALDDKKEAKKTTTKKAVKALDDKKRAQRVGSVRDGFDENAFRAKPELLSGYKQGIFTDSFVLSLDKNVSKKLFEDFIIKPELNKRVKEAEKKSGKAIKSEEKIKIVEDIKEEMNNTSKEKFPNIESLIPDEPSKTVGRVTNFSRQGDSKSMIINEEFSVNVDKLALMEKYFPNAKMRIKDSSSPIQFVENNKVVGLLMPERLSGKFLLKTKIKDAYDKRFNKEIKEFEVVTKDLRSKDDYNGRFNNEGKGTHSERIRREIKDLDNERKNLDNKMKDLQNGKKVNENETSIQRDINENKLSVRDKKEEQSLIEHTSPHKNLKHLNDAGLILLGKDKKEQSIARRFFVEKSSLDNQVFFDDTIAGSRQLKVLSKKDAEKIFDSNPELHTYEKLRKESETRTAKEDIMSFNKDGNEQLMVEYASPRKNLKHLEDEVFHALKKNKGEQALARALFVGKKIHSGEIPKKMFIEEAEAIFDKKAELYTYNKLKKETATRTAKEDAISKTGDTITKKAVKALDDKKEAKKTATKKITNALAERPKGQDEVETVSQVLNKHFYEEVEEARPVIKIVERIEKAITEKPEDISKIFNGMVKGDIKGLFERLLTGKAMTSGVKFKGIRSFLESARKKGELSKNGIKHYNDINAFYKTLSPDQQKRLDSMIIRDPKKTTRDVIEGLDKRNLIGKGTKDVTYADEDFLKYLDDNFMSKKITRSKLSEKEASKPSLGPKTEEMVEMYKSLTLETKDFIDEVGLKKAQGKEDWLAIVKNRIEHLPFKYRKGSILSDKEVERVKDSVRSHLTTYAEDLAYTKYGRELVSEMIEKIKDKKIFKGLDERKTFIEEIKDYWNKKRKSTSSVQSKKMLKANKKYNEKIDAELARRYPEGFPKDSGKSIKEETIELAAIKEIKKDIADKLKIYKFEKKTKGGNKYIGQVSMEGKRKTNIDPVSEKKHPKGVKTIVTEKSFGASGDTFMDNGQKYLIKAIKKEDDSDIVHTTISKIGKEREETPFDSVFLGKLPMHYKMPKESINNDLKLKYPNGATTVQLMEDGVRTATTRKNFGEVGDTFMVNKQKYLIEDIKEIDLKTSKGKAEWEILEGWDVDYAMKKMPNQVKNGAIQTIFSKVGKKVSPAVEKESIPTPYTAPKNPKRKLHSGGAEGSDTYFGRMAEEYGHGESHYSFTGHKSSRPESTMVRLTKQELEAGGKDAQLAARMLQKNKVTNPFIRNLILRNVHQVKNADQVFAISEITNIGQVKGGTGYAIEMAKNKKKEIYVYDQKKFQWYKNNYEKKAWEPVPDSKVNITEDNYAGIGTRNITQDGKYAIEDLYKPQKTKSKALNHSENIKQMRFVDASGIKKSLEEGINSNNPNSIARNKFLDEALTKMFGEEYANNSFLNTIFKKVMKRETEIMGERQPADVVAKIAETYIPGQNKLSKAEIKERKKHIFARRKKESKKQEKQKWDNKAADQRKQLQNKSSWNNSASSKTGESKYESDSFSSEADELLQGDMGGFGVTQISKEKFIEDLTAFDQLSPHRLATETDYKDSLTPKESAEDAASFIINLIDTHNRNIGPKGKRINLQDVFGRVKEATAFAEKSVPKNKIKKKTASDEVKLTSKQKETNKAIFEKLYKAETVRKIELADKILTIPKEELKTILNAINGLKNIKKWNIERKVKLVDGISTISEKKKSKLAKTLLGMREE